MTDRPITPGTIIRMAYDGYGCDDMHVRSGWSYRDIASTLTQSGAERLYPLARLAEKRERDDRAARKAGAA